MATNVAKFLSDEWFTMVSEQTDKFGDLKLSPALQNVNMNLEVRDGEEVSQLNFSSGAINQGLDETSPTTITLEKTLFFSLVETFSTDDAVDAFLSGKARISGDLSQLLVIQGSSISDQLQELWQKILLCTQF